MQPAQVYEIEKDMLQSMLLEDMTLTDLYRDAENFKKHIIYGYDSLTNLGNEIDAGIKECLARPDEYQLVSVLEPVKSRIILIGRTEQFEKNIECLAPIFIAYTWSGYLDNLLCETCHNLRRSTDPLPECKGNKRDEHRRTSSSEKRPFSFCRMPDVVHKILEKTEKSFTRIYEELRQIKNTIKTEDLQNRDARCSPTREQ